MAGMTASLFSQAVLVPTDVVRQKFMCRDTQVMLHILFDVATKIIKSYGVRGLYKGFGLSVMTYSPSSAVWWASYGSSQRVIWRFLSKVCSLVFTIRRWWAIRSVNKMKNE